MPDISFLFREALPKPRERGLTILIDSGLPTIYFADLVQSFHWYIDFVKFGRCTTLWAGDIERKMAITQRHQIEPFFGGILFEYCVKRGQPEGFDDFCSNMGCRYVEISNGTTAPPAYYNGQLIREFARDFCGLSEVGDKNPERSVPLTPAQWEAMISADLDAGATKVLRKSRESAASGICSLNGELHLDMSETVPHAVPLHHLLFEAPTKGLQVDLIKRFGRDANLAHVQLADIVALETVGCELRFDTVKCTPSGTSTCG